MCSSRSGFRSDLQCHHFETFSGLREWIYLLSQQLDEKVVPVGFSTYRKPWKSNSSSTSMSYLDLGDNSVAASASTSDMPVEVFVPLFF